jgi:hypothetical protein
VLQADQHFAEPFVKGELPNTIRNVLSKKRWVSKRLQQITRVYKERPPALLLSQSTTLINTLSKIGEALADVCSLFLFSKKSPKQADICRTQNRVHTFYEFERAPAGTYEGA